ncbi:alpha/beta hydrolase [Paenibacillus chitinolyticus]|uniref:alpha/beta hydrolase n=1 Tax=Paenibacillus chitinolyticus TaxID=79263 RepID=UPI001C482143|nr:alpha/beta hydrolase [Paenibacillus chitinolyticus]MBV6714410.1 alpha/beta hydrolase [Paenibacillus chitinolyticus]
MKKRTKKWLAAAGIVVALLVSVDVGGSFYFYHVAIERAPKYFLLSSPDLGSRPAAAGFNVDGKAWIDSHPYEEMELTSDDGLKLRGYYWHAPAPTKKTVIIAHGYAGKGKDMGIYAAFYHDKLGYNVLIPDDRGHGESEGDYIGFGWPDRKDYVKWIDLMIGKVGADAEIVLHGVSMGGATVLMTSGERLPANVKAVVADCGYTSVEDQLSYQLDRMYHLPSFPIVQSTSLLTKMRAGYGFAEASALEQVRRTKLPVLFIHGDADTFVPFEMAGELYDAAGGEKELFVVPKARHGKAYQTDPTGYESRVTAFIAKYIQT